MCAIRAETKSIRIRLPRRPLTLTPIFHAPASPLWPPIIALALLVVLWGGFGVADPLSGLGILLILISLGVLIVAALFVRRARAEQRVAQAAAAMRESVITPMTVELIMVTGVMGRAYNYGPRGRAPIHVARAPQGFQPMILAKGARMLALAAVGPNDPTPVLLDANLTTLDLTPEERRDALEALRG